MTKTLAFAVAATMLVAGGALAQPVEQWACTADQAVGFKYSAKAKTWEPAAMPLQASRWVIRRARGDERQKGVWVVVRFGDTTPDSICKEDFYVTQLKCQGSTDFEFSSYNMRYVRTNKGGYAVLPNTLLDEEDFSKGIIVASPFVEIGRCSPL